MKKEKNFRAHFLRFFFFTNFPLLQRSKNNFYLIFKKSRERELCACDRVRERNENEVASRNSNVSRGKRSSLYAMRFVFINEKSLTNTTKALPNNNRTYMRFLASFHAVFSQHFKIYIYTITSQK